jgi:hypothetical protein
VYGLLFESKPTGLFKCGLSPVKISAEITGSARVKFVRRTEE